jgi:hypothetical protein
MIITMEVSGRIRTEDKSLEGEIKELKGQDTG